MISSASAMVLLQSEDQRSLMVTKIERPVKAVGMVCAKTFDQPVRYLSATLGPTFFFEGFHPRVSIT